MTGSAVLTARTSTGELYDAALADGGRTPLVLCTPWQEHALPVARWCGPADAADAALLARFAEQLPPGARVLDVGCGPGRHSEHLRGLGLRPLGVDTSRAAVALTRGRGVDVLLADARGPLPHGDHGWDGVLLLDGGIGIGGDPLLLLCRVRDLLAAHGRVLLELDEDGRTDRFAARLGDGVRTSSRFPWARLAAGDELEATLCAADLRQTGTWTAGGRTVVVLAPRGCPS